MENQLQFGIVYLFTSPSGKGYVGQTIDLNERLKGHKKKGSNCTLLKRAINKYGFENMKFKIIEKVSYDALDEREYYWIDELNTLAPNGYNCNTGGKAKKKLSQFMKDNIRNTLNAKKIQKDGYLGYVRIGSSGKFIPTVVNEGVYARLTGGLDTREEAIEMLKLYTQYTQFPDDFSNLSREEFIEMLMINDRLAKGESKLKYIQKYYEKYRIRIPIGDRAYKSFGTFHSIETALEAYNAVAQEYNLPRQRLLDPTPDNHAS
jgi:group I intron endonuclease